MSTQDFTIARTTSSQERSQGSMYEKIQVGSDTNNAVWTCGVRALGHRVEIRKERPANHITRTSGVPPDRPPLQLSTNFDAVPLMPWLSPTRPNSVKLPAPAVDGL
jgi:hypothetical protein